jgi:hypothetical protein
MKFLSSSAAWLVALVIAYAIGGFSLAIYLGVGDRFSLFLYSEVVMQVTVMLFLLFVGWRAWSLILFERPEHLTRRLIADVRGRLFTPQQLKESIPVFLAFIFFISTVTNIKTLIPVAQPYYWDPSFAKIDRAILGGVDPWRVLQPLVGHPWITALLNINYNLWFLVMFSVLYWQLFDLRRPKLRLRFFWTFFLTWIINGSILAIVFSSAGPCFYGHVVNGINPFAEQMAYLRSLTDHYPVWAIATQERLWETYKGNQVGLGSGISAMPSVHVATSMVFVLLGWHYGRYARIFFCLFAACIMIGSVHLAWHYAIDGYVGAFVTMLIWWVMGRIFKDASEAAAMVQYRAGSPAPSE